MTPVYSATKAGVIAFTESLRVSKEYFDHLVYWICGVNVKFYVTYPIVTKWSTLITEILLIVSWSHHKFGLHKASIVFSVAFTGITDCPE